MMNEVQNGSGVLKRFIRYLYEYGQGKRMRNVGFVKVEQGEDECTVHVHGKGLRMGSEKSLQIYLLFEDEGTCFGIWQGEADNINPALNECVSYTAEETGTAENYERINGILLENMDGRRYAALWNDTPMDISNMRIWKEPEEEVPKADTADISAEHAERMPAEEEQREIPAEEEQREIPPEEEQREIPPEEEQREMPAEEEQREMPEEEEQREMSEEEGQREMPAEDAEQEDLGSVMDAVPIIKSEGIFFTEEKGKPQIKKGWQTKKIQRTELAKLARCEWRLANNNFLLHGYYNYHHLILLERGEQIMLGVPGIYHEKEAAAAGAFGFAEFIAKDRLDIKLSPEECNEDHPFGYWCRPVKRAFKWE